MTLAAFWRINAVCIAVLITIVSLTPDTESLDPALSLTEWLSRLVFGTTDSGDKIAHFLAYGAFGFFATLGWGKSVRSLMSLLGFILVYGLLLEMLQLAGGARTGDMLDLLANTAGGIAGLFGALMSLRIVDMIFSAKGTPS